MGSSDSVFLRISSTQLREKQEEGGGARISLRSEEKNTSCPILRVLTRASRRSSDQVCCAGPPMGILAWTAAAALSMVNLAQSSPILSLPNLQQVDPSDNWISFVLYFLSHDYDVDKN